MRLRQVISVLMVIVSMAGVSSSTRCTPLPNDVSNESWLLTETQASGLCNQIVSVFSFVPVAKLLGANVVVAPMFSRHTFEEHWPFPVINWSPVSFSLFYDWPYFQQYWRMHHNLTAIEQSSFEARCESGLQSNAVLNVTRNPVYGAANRAQIHRMLERSQVTLPLPPNSIVQISAQIKFMTLYNFWSEPELLLDVHRSLQPAAPLQKYIKTIIHALPSPLIVLHLRLEPDYWGHSFDKFTSELSKAVAYLMTSKCFDRYRSSSNTSVLSDVPAVYVASGVLSPGDSVAHKMRAKATLSALSAIGLKDLRTQHHVLSPLFHRTVAQNAVELRDRYGDPFLYRHLLPEQVALIDMEVARAASCFVPAHVGSSFSYLVTRMRDWDRGLQLSFEEVHGRGDDINAHGLAHDFRNWGL